MPARTSCTGSAKSAPENPEFKVRSAALFYRILEKMTDFHIPTDAGDFRLMDRKTLDALLTMPEQYRFVRGMVAWIGLNQVALPYRREERRAGQTKYSLNRMIVLAVDAITGFSIAPLRFSFHLAVLAIVLAVLLGGYVFVSWMFFNAVKGWTSLLLLFLLFSSVQLVCISIVGEYVGRTYMQTKQRPLFVVKEVHTGDAEKPV